MEVKERIHNIAGVFGAKYGFWKGRKCLFTHRDPKTSDVYAESIFVDDDVLSGKWIPSEEVTWEN